MFECSRISSTCCLLSKLIRNRSSSSSSSLSSLSSSSACIKRDFDQKHRRYCTTETKVAVSIPRAVRPSPRLIAKFDNKDIFLRLLLELEFLYEAVEAKLPAELTDSNWMKYVQMTSIVERCCYLHQLYESRKEIEEKNKKKMLQAAKTADNKRIPFNTLYYFEKEDFRRFAYEIFGSRLLAAWRCNDSFPPLLVDCRFLTELNHLTRITLVRQMKDLVLDNSLQRNPFPVVFVNYNATTDIAQSIVNSWLRKRCLPKYYPLTVPENDMGTDNEQPDIAGNSTKTMNPISAPFIPVVTSATVRECLGSTDPEEIAYINPKAAEYLPNPVSKYKAFVLCATPDSKLLNSSFYAAKTEQLNSYRFPINQFLNLSRTPVTMPLRITANIIRDLYTNGCEWRIAFEKHIPYFNILAGDMYRNHENDRNDLQILEQWLSDAEKKGKKKRKYFHLYSREERRAAQTILTQKNIL